MGKHIFEFNFWEIDIEDEDGEVYMIYFSGTNEQIEDKEKKDEPDNEIASIDEIDDDEDEDTQGDNVDDPEDKD